MTAWASGMCSRLYAGSRGAGRTPVSEHVPAILESGMAPLRAPKLMMQSHSPLIAIETSEEARLERILVEVATSLRVFFCVERHDRSEAPWQPQQRLRLPGSAEGAQQRRRNVR